MIFFILDIKIKNRPLFNYLIICTNNDSFENRDNMFVRFRSYDELKIIVIC